MLRRALIVIILLLACTVLAGPIVDSFRYTVDTKGGSGQDTTIASAAPGAAMIATPGSGTEPFFATPSANTANVGPYGLYNSIAVDNIIKRGSFETCAGGHPTAWVVSEPGTSAIDCSTDHKAKGANSLKFVAPVGDQPETYSACVEVDKTKDYFFSMWMYGESGDENIRVYIGEYGAANCSGGVIASLYPINGVDIAAGWDRQTTTIASGDWNGSTLAVKIHILSLNTHDAVTFYLDEVEFYQGTTKKDSTCTCDTSVTCSCSATIASLPTKISAGSWEVRMTIQSPVDPDDLTTAYVLYIPETAATNKNRVDIYITSGSIYIDVYDSGGTKKSANRALAVSPAADTGYDIVARHTDGGNIAICVDTKCSAYTTGATTTLINTTTYIGNDGTTPSGLHIKDLEFRRKLSS